MLAFRIIIVDIVDIVDSWSEPPYMFRACGLSTIPRSGNRLHCRPRQWQRCTQTATASQGSPQCDGKDESQHQPHARSSIQSRTLKPVPRVLNAIFEPFQARPGWYDLTDREEIQFTENSTTRRKRVRLPSDVRDIESFNALASRFRILGLQIPYETYALPLAIREPAALRRFLQVNWRDNLLPRQETGSTFLEVAAGLVDVLEEQSLSRDRRRRAQYLHIITGCPVDGERIHDGTPRWALCCWAKECFTPNGDLWPVYIQLVNLFAEPGTVQDEWRNYSAGLTTSLTNNSMLRFYALSFEEPLRAEVGKTRKSRALNKARMTQVGQGMTRDSRIERYGAILLNNARNATIQTLLRSEAWQEAWTLVHECEKPATDITPQSWMALLRYPDGLKGLQQWLPEMEAPALAMLSQEVAMVENSLGLSWTGGENGYHVKSGDPFWVAEDVS